MQRSAAYAAPLNLARGRYAAASPITLNLKGVQGLLGLCIASNFVLLSSWGRATRQFMLPT